MTEPSPREPDDPTLRRVLALLRQHGWNATSFQVLEPGFRYWFDGDDACVAYADTGSAWVAAGAPVAAAGELVAVAERFCRAARERGRRACFFAAEQRLAADVRGALTQVQIGEQPVWDPSAWEATLRGSKSLREQLRRARAKGVRVRAVGADEMRDRAGATRAAVEALVERWLGSRAMAPMGFLVAVEPFAFPDERRYFVAEQQGRVVAFLAAVPVYARAGWFLEDLLRDPSAPNGTAELLFDHAMRALAAEGARYATLGLAPLSGAVPSPLRAARTWGSALYDFRGVEAFKAKLRPQGWDPIYLAYPRGASAAWSLYDSLVAFARGSLSRFGIRSALRGPAVVVQALAALLIPWTAAIAAVDTAHWFPSRWVQRGWVLFDVAVCVGLFALAARWRPWLATTLATAVTADAALTVLEALWYNAPRAQRPGDWLVIALACAAPAFAATVLWRARALRRRWLGVGYGARRG